tara:strand:+ start:170 stop:841 length:672 start_codon:yes stop_codon:yes gene_type:complete
MILDAFKFTNNLFSKHFAKFLTIVFPVYIIIFLVYLPMSSIPGNEFGTTKPFSFLELITNLLTLYAVILSILLIDDICKERKRSITNYFYLGAYLYIKILVINLITVIAVFLGLIALIIPGLYVSARLYFASYLAIIFDEGIINSLKKSIEITQDKGWKILGYLLAVAIPLIFIMILALIGPAIFLYEGNINIYMAIVFFVTFIFMVYITIYGYRLLTNLMET